MTKTLSILHKRRVNKPTVFETASVSADAEGERDWRVSRDCRRSNLSQKAV